MCQVAIPPISTYIHVRTSISRTQISQDVPYYVYSSSTSSNSKLQQTPVCQITVVETRLSILAYLPRWRCGCVSAATAVAARTGPLRGPASRGVPPLRHRPRQSKTTDNLIKQRGPPQVLVLPFRTTFRLQNILFLQLCLRHLLIGKHLSCSTEFPIWSCLMKVH